MRSIIIGIAVSGMLVGSLHAQQREFPYEAVIDVDEVNVRSGPDQSHYPTSTLKRGSRVTVLRHERGGWMRILPPPGSFSWIAKDCVDRIDDRRGRVNKSNFFRIGSDFGAENLTSRHRILIGEEVEIIGEQTLQTERGAVEMYKIKPPVGEHRWIPGQAAIPADGKLRNSPGAESAEPVAQGESPGKPRRADEQPKVDPFAKSGDGLTADRAESRSGASMDRAQPAKTLVNRPLVKISPNGGVRRVAPPVDELKESTDRLEALDAEFRGIISLDKQDWDFATLERDYLAIRDSTPLPAFQAHVDLRLDALRRYQAEKQRYDEFMRIAAEASKRDAQLLALQRQSAAPLATPTVSETVESDPRTPALADDPVSPFQEVPDYSPDSRSPARRPADAPARSQAPLQAGSTTQVGPGPQQPQLPQTAPANRPPTNVARRFDGAGIVQRAAWAVPNGPRHVLLSPNGRILAYLQGATGIDLDRYVGQAVGIYGPRGFRRDLMTDFIEVRSLAPVRLRP